MDRLLDQLAAPSAFSQLSQLPDPASPDSIIKTLFRDSGLSAYAIAVLVQIILRDLRPLLAPLPDKVHPTHLLNRALMPIPAQLGLSAAMQAWDPAMASLYRGGKGCLDWCADTAERRSYVSPGPVVGVNVQVGAIGAR